MPIVDSVNMTITEGLTLSTPSLLFSAISLILLAYTNRFLSYAQVVRNLKAEYDASGGDKTASLAQIKNLFRRMQLVRAMQILGALSLLLCLGSMFFIYMNHRLVADLLFGAGMLSLAASLVFCIWEINISVFAMEVHLQEIKPKPEPRRPRSMRLLNRDEDEHPEPQQADEQGKKRKKRKKKGTTAPDLGSAPGQGEEKSQEERPKPKQDEPKPSGVRRDPRHERAIPRGMSTEGIDDSDERRYRQKHANVSVVEKDIVSSQGEEVSAPEGGEEGHREERGRRRRRRERPEHQVSKDDAGVRAERESKEADSRSRFRVEDED